MANPKHKTCLSVLRSVIGSAAGNEARFAEKIGRSTSWLKKASCGQIPITKDIALRIAYETGISMRWLMQGNTSKTPVDKDDKTFTKATYENYRSFMRDEYDLEDAIVSERSMYDGLWDILRIFIIAQENNKGGLFAFRLTETLNELERGLGINFTKAICHDGDIAKMARDFAEWIDESSTPEETGGFLIPKEIKQKQLKPQKRQSSVKKAPRKTKI